MTDPVAFTDLNALGALRRDARAPDAGTVKQAAQQFESLFLRMMLKSMREASAGDSMFDSNESGFYRDMFDDQIAVEMSRGGGMGLADMLVQQLSLPGAATQANAYPSTVANAPANAAAQASAATVPEQRAFVEKLWPIAESAGKALGIDPRHVVAQAALETGWGKSLPLRDGQSSHNYFGIKAGVEWRSGIAKAVTQEFVNGRATTVGAPFRAYENASASVGDYVRLLTNNARYSPVIGTGADIGAFSNALQASGYATDPNYATKLQAVAQVVNAMAPPAAKLDSSHSSALPIPVTDHTN